MPSPATPRWPGSIRKLMSCIGRGLPLEIYPISAGVKGGLAGSVAMAVLAVAYGMVVQHSIWYPINLLATGFLPGSAATTAALAAFHWDSSSSPR